MSTGDIIILAGIGLSIAVTIYVTTRKSKKTTTTNTPSSTSSSGVYDSKGYPTTTGSRR